MTRDDIIKEALMRGEYRLNLAAHPPEELAGLGADDVAVPAISVAISDHLDTVTLLVEVGLDNEGRGYVTARAIDTDGAEIAPTVLDLGTNFMMMTPPLTKG